MINSRIRYIDLSKHIPYWILDLLIAAVDTDKLRSVCIRALQFFV